MRNLGMTDSTTVLSPARRPATWCSNTRTSIDAPAP
ncbi:MAG: hypothetical protein H6Q29_150, partial [Bacteroidetes bacterium]|nr:hypothetical protein [Bacteroidota bacterium]